MSRRSDEPEASVHTVVVLLHGIRTHAVWQERIAVLLKDKDGVEVIPVGYDYFDAFRFWCPILTRRKPIEKILRELRQVMIRHRAAKVCVLAHSFGTYAIAKILETQGDIKIHRLALCGSIISTDYRWDLRPNPPGGIVNDCGTRDIWPVLAKSLSWGYGPTGTFGFKSVAAKDRFHNLDHSGFFSEDFAKTYWVPFLCEGVICESTWSARRPNPSKFLTLLAWLPLYWIFLCIMGLGIVGFGLTEMGMLPTEVVNRFPGVRETRAAELIGQVEHDFEDGELASAVVAKSQLSRAISLDPRAARAYSLRSIVNSKLEQHDEALTDAKVGFELSPNTRLSQYALAHAALHAGKSGVAIKMCNMLLSFEPQYAEAYLIRGIANANAENLEQALRDLEAAILLDPHLDAARLNRGLVFAELKLWDHALTDYAFIIESGRATAKVYHARGVLWSRTDGHEKAVHDYSLAIDKDPGNAAVFQNRGMAYIELARYTGAIQDFDRARALGGNADVLLRLRATAHFSAGDSELACRDWRESCRLSRTRTCRVVKGLVCDAQVSVKDDL